MSHQLGPVERAGLACLPGQAYVSYARAVTLRGA